jgi:hypothetical protein
MALTPEQIAAMPEPLRRRFLRLSRTFAAGLFLVLAGITAAVLASGLMRTLGLAGIGTGALIIGGTFLYAYRVGARDLPLPPPPVNGTAKKSGEVDE